MLKTGFTMALALTLLPIYAQVIYVKKDAPGLNNGTSWTNAFTNLTTALQKAGHGTEVWVAEGSYAPESPNTFDVPSGFHLPSGVKLLGGFAGIETNAGQRDWTDHETILTAKGNTYFSTNVVYAEGTDTSTILDGFTIRDGAAYAFYPLSPCDSFINQYACFGGGIYLFSGDSATITFLTVKNSKFTKNGAFAGGAIYANFAAGRGGLSLFNCTFEENTALESGGAIKIYGWQYSQLPICINNCMFSSNYADYSSSCISVSSYYDVFKLKIANSIFYKNKARFNSGVLYLGGGTHEIENCIFQDNQTDLDFTVSGVAGAIGGSGIRAINCVFTGNKARIGGVANVGEAEFVGCLFANNSATQEGGVLRNAYGCKFVNCSFVNNFAGELGGAIYNIHVSGEDTIINCVFANNKAGQKGDILYPATAASTKTYMAHCMLDIPDCATLEMVNPAINFLTCGPGMLFNLDPYFRDTASGDYRPGACSPLLDSGDSTWLSPFGLDVDLAGAGRIQNANVDIGAYEISRLLADVITRDVQCFGDANGVAALVPSGGFSSYTFAWGNGGQDSIKTNLTAGNYAATVYDADGCTDTVSISITQPDSIYLSVTSVDNTDMMNPNGWAVVDSISGGVPPYEYLWNTGAAADSIFNLPAGIYSLTVTDAHNCTRVEQTTVEFIVKTKQAVLNEGWLMVHPNPASEYINVLLLRTSYPGRLQSIELFGISGNKMAAFPATTPQTVISLSGYAPGIYWLRVLDYRGMEVGRQVFVKL